MMISAAAAKFVQQLRADTRFGDDMAEHFVASFRDLEVKADRSGDVFEVQSGIEWICEQPRSLDEKLDALEKMFALKGKVTVTMTELTGWR